MPGHAMPSLLAALAAIALCAGGCSSSGPSDAKEAPSPAVSSSRKPVTSSPEPTAPTQTPTVTATDVTSSPGQTDPANSVSSQADSKGEPGSDGEFVKATARATQTQEAFPENSTSSSGVPTFSSDSCAQSTDQNCLDTVDAAPLGAAPPQSQVTGTGYSYTVTSYVDWIMTDLHTEWTKWFVENNFAAPTVYYKIIHETDPPYVMSCPGGPASVAHDYPNAFYCSSDPYYNLRGTTEDGLIVLPVTTMQRMWTGDVLGTVSKKAGDFAAAIIIAHEYGHNVQDELALQWEKYYPGKVPGITGSNKEAIADCFAGVWMNTTYYDGILEPGDFEEGVEALNAVGATQPGSTHPTSAQREVALKLGYNSGDPMQCVDSYWK